MKTLTGWIVGIFALGLGLGSILSSASSDRASTEPGVEVALDTAIDVDCGEGRDALLEPVSIDGVTSYKIRCVSRSAPTQASPVLAAPTLPVVASAQPEPHPVAVDIRDHDKDSRTWKQSAVVIGGSAGAGAGVGAIAKGKKGAAVGAAIGAITGTAYELLKRDKK